MKYINSGLIILLIIFSGCSNPEHGSEIELEYLHWYQLFVNENGTLLADDPFSDIRALNRVYVYDVNGSFKGLIEVINNSDFGIKNWKDGTIQISLSNDLPQKILEMVNKRAKPVYHNKILFQRASSDSDFLFFDTNEEKQIVFDQYHIDFENFSITFFSKDEVCGEFPINELVINNEVIIHFDADESISTWIVSTQEQANMYLVRSLISRDVGAHQVDN